MTSLDQSSPPSNPRSSSPRNNSTNSPVENGAKKNTRPPKIRTPKIKKSHKLKRGKNIYLKRKPGGDSPRSARKKGAGNNSPRNKTKRHTYDPNTVVRLRYQTKVDTMIKARRNMFAMDENMFSNAKMNNMRRSTPKLDKLLGKKMVSRLLNAGRVANELNRPRPELDQPRHHFPNNATPWFKKRNTGIVRDAMVRESMVRDSIGREPPPKQNFNVNSMAFELAYLRTREANDKRKMENMSVEIMRLKGDLFNKDEQIEQLKAMINILHQYSDQNIDQKKMEPTTNFGFEEKVDTTDVDPPKSDSVISGEKSIPPANEFTCNAENEAVAMLDFSPSKSSKDDDGQTECDGSERGTSDLKVPDEEVIYPWNFPGNAQDTPKNSTQDNNSVSMEDIEEGICDVFNASRDNITSSNESDPQTPSNTQSSVNNFVSSTPPKTEKTEKQKYLSFGDYFVTSENDKSKVSEKDLSPGDYDNIRKLHYSGHVAQNPWIQNSDAKRKNIHLNDKRWPMTKLQYQAVPNIPMTNSHRHSPPHFAHGMVNPSIVHPRINSSHPYFAAANKHPMHPVFPEPKQHFNPQQAHPQPAQILIPINKLQYLQVRQDQNNQHAQIHFPNENLPFSKAHYNRNSHRVYHNNGPQMHHEPFLSPQYMSHATALYPHNFPGGRYFQQ